MRETCAIRGVGYGWSPQPFQGSLQSPRTLFVGALGTIVPSLQSSVLHKGLVRISCVVRPQCLTLFNSGYSCPKQTIP